MDLKNNKDLKEMMRTFVVLDKDVLSSDEDTTLDELGVPDVLDVLDEELVSARWIPIPSVEVAEKVSIENAQVQPQIPVEELEIERKVVESHNPTPFERIIEQSRILEQAQTPAGETALEGRPENFYSSFCSQYLNFTNQNPTTFHAIDYISELLVERGFTFLPEKEPYKIDQGGLFFSTRGDQSMVAFILGGKWKPLNGVGVVGCHVDALTAKLKPSSIKLSVSGYDLLGVAPYSGGLSHLWIDRDLGIAGSILVKDVSGKISKKLVSSGNHAIARIPSLAPHFGSKSSLPYNKETQMVPVIGYGNDPKPATPEEKKAPLFGKHSLALLRYIAKLGSVEIDQILQLDLELFDVQKAVRGGLSREFMFAPRIDDRLCSFSAVHALLETAESLEGELSEYDGFSIVYLANNEEIGSSTRTGARGKFLNSVVERVCGSGSAVAADVALTFANSVLLSADVTHALNPNFKSAYLEGHFPLPNVGLTIKKDANGHVMTDLIGVVLMEAIAARHGLTLQQFHIRNDMPSGGTIGPMLAVDTGARVVDVGLAQLSMHSIRAAAGYKEVGIGVETFSAFFRDWRGVLDEIDYN